MGGSAFDASTFGASVPTASTLGASRLRRDLFLLGREFGRVDLSRGRYRLIRRGHIGSGRPGAEGSGFTAGGLVLLIAHVGFSRID